MLCLACSARGWADTRRRLGILALVPAGIEGGTLEQEVTWFTATVVVTQMRHLKFTVNQLLPLPGCLDNAARNSRVPIWVHFWQTLATFLAVKVVVVALVFVRLQVELKG
jgi:hypothetical protein